MENDTNQKKETSRTPLWKRILAAAAVVLMLLLAAGLIAAAFGNAEPGVILLFLFGLMIVPCIAWLLYRFGEISRKK